MPHRTLLLILIPLIGLQACVFHDRRTMGAILDDQNIEMKAGARIIGDNQLGKNAHVNITSMNGIVLLTGETATTEARDRILDHVRTINGVRRINNELEITEPSTMSHRSKDTLITSAVNSRLLVTRGVRPSQIKVVTEAGSVYLMGLVTQSEGDLAAEQAATIDGVVRVVKVFEYID